MIWEILHQNHCEIVIMPHNLTNKFHPLDLSVKKAAKASVSQKYNFSMANENSKQLKKEIVAPDVKVSLLFSVTKPLHAKWIVDLYFGLWSS